MKTGLDILAALMLILVGCTQKQSNENISVDIPQELKYPYSYIQQIGSQIDYSLSEQDKKGKEIRIWINEELLEPKTLIELKEINNVTFQKWIHYHYSRDNKRNYKLDSLKLNSRTINLKIDSIINNLNILGFDKVQSQPDSIKQMIGDGTTYVIEVKKDGYYKAIDCNTPHYFDDANNRKLTEILKYLSKSIGFYYNEKEK